MSYTTFTVTVSNPGSGNKYYLNGALTPTISLAKGATYRFDQSDASNNTHPLVFSSDSGNSSPYTTGVTSVGTPGQAGAYTQIVLANSAPTSLYYYCSNHAGMGGQANTNANSWGALQWGQGNWSAQSDDSGQPSGTVSTFSVGSVTNSADANISLSGVQLSSFQGASVIRFDANVSVSGIQFSSSVGTTGEATIDHTVSVTGSQLASSIGAASGEGIIQIGWGGDTWGENQWGELSGSEPTIVGQQLTSTIGTLQSITGNANVNAVGQSLTSTQGAAVGGASVDVEVTGILQSLSIGSSVVGIGATVTGQSLTSTIGTATVDETTLTGEGWGRGEWGEFAWGDNFSVQLTGMQLTSSIGAETAITDVNVSVTSAGQLTSTFGSFSLKIDQDIFVLAAEDQLDITNGGVAGTSGLATVDLTGSSITSQQGITIGGTKTPVDVTGIQASFTLGNFTLVQTTNESVTGQQATMSLGTHAEIPDQIIGVTGLSITSSLGEEGTTGDAEVIPTGQLLTSSIGNVNITAWSEVDLGVSNTWAEVDRAA